MEKRFFRICSVLLTLVMLLNMVPLSAIAEEYFTIETEDTDFSEISIEEPQIIEEVVEHRTKFSKEFRLDNGLFVSAVYSMPVHYAVDGGWKEIDNTLKAGANGVYTNTAGVWSVQFPQKMSKNNAISIEKDGYVLSFYMAGELQQPGNLELTSALLAVGLTEETETFTLTAEDNAVQTFSVESAQAVFGQIQEVDLTQSREEAQFEEFVAEKNISQLLYADVYENTDIQYDLQGNRVKESIILEQYSSTLRGYRYTLDVGDMIPVLQEDNSIYFYDSTQENIIMVMPAPYLVDQEKAHSFDVSVKLMQNGETWTLSYLLPQQWLSSKERCWPVVLDPVVIADLSDTNIQDTTIISARIEESNYMRSTLQVGYSAADGISRILLAFKELPSLKSSDVVVKAQVSLNKIGTGSNTIPVTVHKVLDIWDVEYACWDDDIPFDSTIEDYAMVSNAGRYYWDVTDIVQYWYEEENLGMLIKASDDIEQSGNTSSWKEFYSCNYGDDRTDPALVIWFRNNNGLESYWDYTTVSASEAGTGYINNYTGNLVWVREDIGFGGSRMPVSISHIYNMNDADNNTFGLGYGWRTNFNQRVYQWSEDSNYYVWEDSDGTDHYFYYDSANTYKDEDGLELTLKTNGSGTEKYKITDKNGNISFFDTLGRLTKQQNNQATKSSIIVNYKTADSDLISQITDGAGRIYRFTYNSSNLLEKIAYLGTGTTEIDSVSFGYGGCWLYYIYGVGNEEYEFDYDEENNLYYVRNYSGYNIRFTHYPVWESWQPSRVKNVCEYDGATKGGELSFVYDNNQTAITDVINGNKEILQFNNFGNLLSTQDSEGRAVYAQYANNNSLTTSNTGKANQLKLSSKMQNTVGNLVKDSSFEHQMGHYCSSTSTVVSYPTTYAYSGQRSLYMQSIQYCYLGVQTFTVQPGETYTYSAYAKLITGSVHIILSPSGNLAGNVTSEILRSSCDWTRLQATYTNTSSAAVSVSALAWCSENTQAYFDCAQIEKAPTASRYNIVENGDFRNGSYGWSYSGLSGTDGVTTTTTPASATQLNNSVIQIKGVPANVKYAYQNIQQSGVAGDTFVLSGWARGISAPFVDNRKFAVIGKFNYTDGSTKEFAAQFNPDTNEWQYAAEVMVAEKAYSSITIQIAYNYNVNTVHFDGIQLYKEKFGTSYTYDSDGNVKSVQDIQGQITNYEYNTSGDLTKILQGNKAKMTYTYDSYHNVKTATSEEGVVYEFGYDTYGNNTSVSIVSGGSKITSTAAYTADGNRMVSSTDASGNVTKYSYNANTNVLEWVQYPNDTDGTENEDTWDTRTYYYYDSMCRLSIVDAETNGVNYFRACYDYNSDGQLSDIETLSTWYKFYYGAFGLRSSVKIWDWTLAEYTYTNDRNYYLDTLDYGNGDSIQYEYDHMGRVTKQTYEDGQSVSYRYDNNGALATVTDSETGIKTTYYYDFTDRMMKYVESGTGYSHALGYEYDQLNNLTSIVDTINGVKRTTSYSYDEDNRIESVTNGDSSANYTYDGFGRVSQEQTKDGGNVVLTDSYTFRKPTSATTSTQVATHSVASSGYNTTYSYTYDDNGNILSVSDGTYTTSYVYDSQNQLLRENNQRANKTWTWTYDDAGNIKAKNEYTYTTGDLDTATDTISYAYGNGGWGDLLTSYDGNAITYDGVGNPLTYGSNTYTWKHGRQLASLSDGTTTWSYTYNADGLRTKRTNGTTAYGYVYSGSSLAQMTAGTDTLYFAYDANGTPMALTLNGTDYYYVTNLQGDVIAILNDSGTAVVTYTYDAWGKLLSTDGTMATTLGTLNPLRYRGYVYDVETGLYYVSSRYYDPEIGRFINADSLVDQSSVLGYNLFAYCRNNPVNMTDTTGNLPFFAITAAVGAVFGAIVGGVKAAKAGKSVLKGALVGAAVGGLVGAGLGAVASAALAGSVVATTTQVAIGAGQLVSTVATGGLGAGAAYIANNLSQAANNLAPAAQTTTSTLTNTSRGSTGRTEPANLIEKLAMEQVKSNPSAGTPLTKFTLNDPRWPSSEGWVKMQQIVPTSQGDINIHYVYNQTLNLFDDFKFKP